MQHGLAVLLTNQVADDMRGGGAAGSSSSSSNSTFELVRAAACFVCGEGGNVVRQEAGGWDR